MAKTRIPVSDHAVLRYLERVCAIDTDAIRQRIHRDVRQAAANGASGVTVNGIRYRLRDGVVVTVIVPSAAPRKAIKWPGKEA